MEEKRAIDERSGDIELKIEEIRDKSSLPIYTRGSKQELLDKIDEFTPHEPDR